MGQILPSMTCGHLDNKLIAQNLTTKQFLELRQAVKDDSNEYCFRKTTRGFCVWFDYWATWKKRNVFKKG